MKKYIILAMFILLLPMSGFALESGSLGQKLSGKLLLQVEDKGRIWYVSTVDNMRYEVGVANALAFFRSQSLGITQANLLKIAIDSRSMEQGADTNYNGVSDVLEAQNNTNPFGSGDIVIDSEFANSLKGKLLLDVEDLGRVWYVDFNGKRWNINTGNVMTLFRQLSLGITNENLLKIIPLRSLAGVRGAKNSAFEFVTYCSMEGPYCLRFKDTLDQLYENYGDQVKFVVKHYPLQFHTNSQYASEAVECAGEQGQFWPMYDEIYKLNSLHNIRDNTLKLAAEDLGLNTVQFNYCLDHSVYEAKVLADMVEGIDRGATGTPSSFMNDVSIPGAYLYSEVQQILLSVLEGNNVASIEDDLVFNEFDDSDNLKDKNFEEEQGDRILLEESEDFWSNNTYETAIVIPEISAEESFLGNVNGDIEIITYCSFECPFCSRFDSTLDTITEKYPNRIKRVYRHFPLSNMFVNAQKAAEAAECAKDQGQFWQMHDKLLEAYEGGDLGITRYKAIAVELGLNTAKFNYCLNNSLYAVKVSEQEISSEMIGIVGTPTTFVNGQRVSGAVSLEYLEEVVVSKF